MLKIQPFANFQSVKSNSRQWVQKKTRSRRLSLEQLELRQLLSVSPCSPVEETAVHYVASCDDAPIDFSRLELGQQAASEQALPETLSAAGNVQKISSTTASVSVQSGENFTVPVKYEVMDGNGHLTGLGLRIHYDSSKLSFSGVENFFGISRVSSVHEQDDVKNNDGDSRTDKVLVVSWMDPDGMWPGSSEQVLMNLKFTAKTGTSGTSKINFTYSSKAAGYTFESEPVSVTIHSSGHSEYSEYDETEFTLLRDFLETESGGVKNGQRLSSNYQAEAPSTWGGITWEMKSDGVKHATKICWKDADLTGSVALASLEKLTCIDSTGNNSLEIKNISKDVKSATESTFKTVITLDSGKNKNEETVSENTAVLNEWSTFALELWTDFTADKVYEIKWDANVFSMNSEKIYTRYGVHVESQGKATVSKDGLTTQTFVLSTETGYTANVGETLAATFNFTPATSRGALAVGDSLNSAITVNGKQIETKVYSVVYDLDEQGSVDINDLITFAKFFSSTNENSWKADFNVDGKVDTQDLILFARNFGLSPDGAGHVQFSGNYKPQTSVPTAVQSASSLTDYVWTDLWSELEGEEEERLMRLQRTSVISFC